MATVLQSMRLSARAAAKYASSHAARRAFTYTARDRAATNFTMPALSPTMTEGNIAQWRVKEGDSYSAGDVLLEIETDKATMDVEAQEDGVLMKIMSPDGSKAVQVGSRIAVTAEAGDDVSSLEIPEDDTAKGQPAKDVAQEKKTMTGKETATEESAKTEEKKSEQEPAKKGTESSSKSTHGSKTGKQKYPLYPSVQHLLHQNGLSDATAEEIPASGPSGRLLKGDVLAYLGKISKDYPAEASARLTKLSHLDLSNIQIAVPPPKPAETPAAAHEPEVPSETELALPISLEAVVATQKRMETMLHTSLPLSVFIARASELANEKLPLTQPAKSTSEDLFNAVLGIPYSSRTASRGHFIPQISTFDASAAVKKSSSSKKNDIFDIIIGNKPKKASIPAHVGISDSSTSENLFSVVAKSGEEERAMIYLERMKYALEQDPGRLVL
ncbi:hypothetical protein AMS68_002456 [Peltaster fructicola]|uniref:Dihydrolipoamide acetyltransferase component of pyruvate dehydrogenase complex n=1 Tax=Peltaster fructicola TaxID=286661 RepID=A0A6H0XQP3_9PEZI|nr:hypothetical protein AMS68_002456 [Peltaster fructicola]